LETHNFKKNWALHTFKSEGAAKKNIFFFTCGLDTLCPGQRPKGLCSDYNPGSIRLRGRITMERKIPALQKGLTAGVQARLIAVRYVEQRQAAGRVNHITSKKSGGHSRTLMQTFNCCIKFLFYMVETREDTNIMRRAV
jgi:hypothetical protein